MAESASPRPSRSRSRSPSQHSDEEPGACSDSEPTDYKRTVIIVPANTTTESNRGRSGVDKSASQRASASKGSESDTKRSTQLAEKPRQSQSQSNTQSRNSVPNTPLRPPRASAPVERMESARTNSNASHSDDYGRAAAYPSLSAVADEKQHEASGRHRSHERSNSRPLRSLDDTSGRRTDLPPQKHQQHQHQQTPRDIIFTIFNRNDHYSIDVHEWTDHTGAYYHAFQYYRGAPSAGYRAPANQIGQRSREYSGRYASPCPTPATFERGPKRERSPERMEPTEYERSPKRARSVENSYGNQYDSPAQHKFNVSRAAPPNAGSSGYSSKPQLTHELVDQFYAFLQSADRTRVPSAPVDYGRSGEYYGGGGSSSTTSSSSAFGKRY